MNTFLKFLLSRDGLVAVGTLVLLAAVAHFNTERPWVNFTARVGNLLVFLYILWRAAGKQLCAFFGNRRAAIAQDMERIEQRKTGAEDILTQLDDLLAKLETERNKILSESRAQAASLRADILERAEKEAAAIRGHAVRTAGSHSRSELVALRASMADEIAKAVETALRTGITPEQHAAIIETSLKKVDIH